MRRYDALGEFEQSILLAIVHLMQAGEDVYGVTIRHTLESRTGRPVSVGALYTGLERLENKGYVRSSMSDPTPNRGGRSKRCFVLASAGADALERSRENLARMWNGIGALPRRTRG